MAKIALSWGNDSNIHSHQKIYKSLTVFDSNTLPNGEVTIGRDVRVYEDTDVVEGLTYYYAVATVDWNGAEYLSDVLEVEAVPGNVDPYWSSVVALLHLDGDFTDEKGAVWTPVSPSFVTSPPGFGSQFYPGLVGYATTPASSAFDLSSAEFTVEMFHTPVGAAGQEAVLSTRTADGGWEVRADRGGALTFLPAGRNWLPAAAGTHTLPSGRSHLAICRYANGTAKAFVNGQVVHTFTSAQNPIPTSAPLTLGRGAYSSFLRPSDSYIDEVRITNGVARYTENFAPPTEPFPNYGV